jgi:hypothetical protein
MTGTNCDLFAHKSSQSFNERVNTKRWAGHVEHTGRSEVHKGLCRENLRELNHLGNLDADGMIILKRIFKKQN